MKKYIMSICKLHDTSDVWEEDIEYNNLDSLADAQEKAQSIIDDFNKTEKLRYDSDKTFRRLLHVRLAEEEGRTRHEWEKTNLVTKTIKGVVYDTYKCSLCKATGKRSGLSENIKPDKANMDLYYCKE